MRDREKRYVRDSYDSLGGKLYNIRYQHEQESKNDLILKHISLLPEDILLDDGCGTGLLLRWVRSHSVGVDVSSKLLSAAHAQLRNRHQAHLAQGDADSLPFRSAIFDKVFAVTLIQNTPDPTRTLREMRRVSKSGSIVTVTALKKSCTPQALEQFISGSELTLMSVVRDEGIKDWIALARAKVWRSLSMIF